LKRIIVLVLTLGFASQLVSGGSQPQVKWIFQAESQLYAPPLVADVCPNPGQETIISDSEVRKLRCVDATGNPIWEFSGNWKKRLPSAAALSFQTGLDFPVLVIGNGDGTLTCVNAATGAQLWQKRVGAINWGNALWADLDGDGRHEIVAGTEDAGIHALDATGKSLWQFSKFSGARAVAVLAPLAAADLDADGKSEIFAVDKAGPFCLNADGTLRWSLQTGDEFQSAPSLADANRDGHPELYCSCLKDPLIYSIDAGTGAVNWRFATFGAAEIYSGSSIAVGDLDEDGASEIVFGDDAGYIYCLNPAGELYWYFPTEKRVHAAASLGDVDGDGAIEVLVASGDHSLYCLNSEGFPKWRYPADLRLIYSPTISDVDHDGKADILVCGSDRKLRCLALDARYQPERMPWPSRRCDTAQSGSCLPQSPRQKVFAEQRALFQFGDFEQFKEVRSVQEYPAGSGILATRKQLPRGWSADAQSQGEWGRDSTLVFSQKFSAKVVPAAGSFLLATAPIEISPELKSSDVAVFGKGRGAVGVKLVWQGLNGVLRRDDLIAGKENKSGWKKFAAEKLKPPRGSKWLKLVCETRNQTAWWDEATILGNFLTRPVLRALVNQLGYEPAAPKRFTVQCNFPATSGEFELLNQNDKSVFRGRLTATGRIQGAYGHDWGFYYWRGDFTGFLQPGKYRIRVVLDDLTDISWPFEIGENLLWERTVTPAYRFFYFQRCGVEIPGFHKACHLDDATDEAHTVQLNLAGGWHDAGDYNKYHNAPYVLGLATAYGLAEVHFKRLDSDQNGVADFLDEILWGADFSRRMVYQDGSVGGSLSSGWSFFGAPEQETDNLPGTGDERVLVGMISGNDPSHHTAALAKVARFAPTDPRLLAAAKRSLDWSLAHNRRGTLQLSAATDLFAATGDSTFAKIAHDLFAEAGLKDVVLAREFDRVFGTDHSGQIKEIVLAEAERLLGFAQNPFGMCTYGPVEKPNFFGTPAKEYKFELGSNSYLLESAAKVALAYQYQPDPRFLEFIWDQFNWILGNNPFDLSMLEGIGSKNPPTYHHRYILAGVPRGAVPGSVVNGIFWQAIADDRPRFDLSGTDIPYYASNECWLPHNTNYLKALVNWVLLQK
jgi:endoglucanase